MTGLNVVSDWIWYFIFSGLRWSPYSN